MQVPAGCPWSVPEAEKTVPLPMAMLVHVRQSMTDLVVLNAGASAKRLVGAMVKKSGVERV